MKVSGCMAGEIKFDKSDRASSSLPRELGKAANLWSKLSRKN